MPIAGGGNGVLVTGTSGNSGISINGGANASTGAACSGVGAGDGDAVGIVGADPPPGEEGCPPKGLRGLDGPGRAGVVVGAPGWFRSCQAKSERPPTLRSPVMMNSGSSSAIAHLRRRRILAMYRLAAAEPLTSRLGFAERVNRRFVAVLRGFEALRRFAEVFARLDDPLRALPEKTLRRVVVTAAVC